MNYECCVCDLDGTLLNSSNKISSDDHNALKLLSNLGLKVVIATGRSDLMIKEYLNDLDIQAPVISCNGGLIRDNHTGEVLYMKLIEPELAKQVINYCDSMQIQYLVYTPFTIYHSSNNARVERYQDYNKTAAEKFRIPLVNIDTTDLDAVTKNTIKILICGEDKSFIDELNCNFNSRNGLTIVSSQSDLIDIMSTNITKGNALVTLSQTINVDLKKTVVFGDNYNDISMFKAAGHGIAVNNAEEELKKIAGYITKSNDESGVSYAIHNYILTNKNTGIKGVILDMDGVMVDSYEYHFEAWRQFSDIHNLNLTDEDIKKDFGRRNRDIFKEVFSRDLTEEEIQLYDSEKEYLYRELHRNHIEPAPGLIDFLTDLKKNGVKTAVGSSAPLYNIKFVMDGLKVGSLIDEYAHAGMVKKGKPSPEIFIKAAELIGIPPEDCVVFEDSLPGIEAGLNAGMKVVALATTHPENELFMAHEVINDFKGLTKTKLEKMLYKL